MVIDLWIILNNIQESKFIFKNIVIKASFVVEGNILF
jgi:hypothetical protein